MRHIKTPLISVVPNCQLWDSFAYGIAVALIIWQWWQKINGFDYTCDMVLWYWHSIRIYDHYPMLYVRFQLCYNSPWRHTIMLKFMHIHGSLAHPAAQILYIILSHGHWNSYSNHTFVCMHIQYVCSINLCTEPATAIAMSLEASFFRQ